MLNLLFIILVFQIFLPAVKKRYFEKKAKKGEKVTQLQIIKTTSN